MNVFNNPRGDHESVEAPGEGNAQDKVPKFLILEGKSSQLVPNHPERFPLYLESFLQDPKFPGMSELRERVSQKQGTVPMLHSNFENFVMECPPMGYYFIVSS